MKIKVTRESDDIVIRLPLGDGSKHLLSYLEYASREGMNWNYQEGLFGPRWLNTRDEDKAGGRAGKGVLAARAVVAAIEELSTFEERYGG
jgi:hypothetical protein